MSSSLDLLAGMTSVIGDELSEVAGYRSTRATALAAPGARVVTGTANASSADDGITVTFSSSVSATGVLAGQRFRLLTHGSPPSIDTGVNATGSRLVVTFDADLDAAIQPGRRFYVRSGAFDGASSLINRRVSVRELELLIPIGEFSNEDWEVVEDRVNFEALITTVNTGAGLITSLVLGVNGIDSNFTASSWEILTASATDIDVESTSSWPTSGFVFTNGRRLRYTGTTATSLTSVRDTAGLRKHGEITAIPGADIVEGETFTIDDGQGTLDSVRVFEFEKPAGSTAPVNHIAVQIDDSMTAAQVATAIATAINATNGAIVAWAVGSMVFLWNTVPGGAGRIDVVSDVADVDFVVDGPAGVYESVLEQQEIVEHGIQYSVIDAYVRDFVVEYAEGSKLSVIGSNLGVPRPTGLADAEYRRFIQAAAYGPRGTIYAVELVLDATLGVGRWELLEDLTSASPIERSCTVYFRRRNDHELGTRGKIFLAGEAARPISSAGPPVVISGLPADIVRVTSVRLAPEPGGRIDLGGVDFGAWGYRLICQGDTAESADGYDVEDLSTALVNVLPGDLFLFLGGRYAGTFTTVLSFAAGVATMHASTDEPIEGASIHAGVGSAFTPVPWAILRPISNFRHYRPSSELYVEYPGASPVAAWTFTGTTEATEFVPSYAYATDALGLRCLPAGAASYYSRRLRISPGEDFCVRFRIRLVTGYATGAATGRQFAVVVNDGVTSFAFGVRGGTPPTIGFIYMAGGTVGEMIDAERLVALNTTIEVEMRRVGDYVTLSTNGSLDQLPASAFSGVAGAPHLRFGQLNATSSCETIVLTADWRVENTRDFWAARFTGSITGDTLTSGSNPFVAADDDAPWPRTLVRILNVDDGNGEFGNVRGEWEIATYNGAGSVDLIGPRQHGLTFNPRYPNRVYGPFVFPDHQGLGLEILSGPNAGTYTITEVLNADGRVREQFTGMLSAAGGLAVPTEQCMIAELDSDLPDPTSVEPAAYRLLPVTDAANVTFEIIEAGTLSGTTATMRNNAQLTNVTTADVVLVGYESERSAFLEDAIPVVGQNDVTGASSVDGLTVALPAGAVASSPIGSHVGHYLVIFGLTDTAAPRKCRIETAGPGDEVRVEAPGFGTAFTDVAWQIQAGPENQPYPLGDPAYLPVLRPAYLFDNFGPVRDAVQTVMPAGVIPNFDALVRDVANYPGTEVDGLHIIDEDGDQT